MPHEESVGDGDPYGDVEVELIVDGRSVPLNAFSKRSISRVVVSLISSYRGAERYRTEVPHRLEVRIS